MHAYESYDTVRIALPGQKRTDFFAIPMGYEIRLYSALRLQSPDFASEFSFCPGSTSLSSRFEKGRSGNPAGRPVFPTGTEDAVFGPHGPGPATPAGTAERLAAGSRAATLRQFLL